jgi:hypothetical protein
MDEMGIFTFQKHGRILGPKRLKQVGVAGSWECGNNVKAACSDSVWELCPTNVFIYMYISQEANVPTVAKEWSILSPFIPALEMGGLLKNCSSNGFYISTCQPVKDEPVKRGHQKILDFIA